MTRRLALRVAVLPAIAIACASTPARERSTGGVSDGRYAMGTVFEITLHGIEREAAQALLDSVARENAWSVYHTENAAVFNNAQLALFDVVILNNSSGTVYLQDQQDAFRSFVEGGGGVVALHAAGGDSSYVWGWYARELIRAQFVDHPMANHIQEATLDVEELAHPVVMHLGRRWVRSDEFDWYETLK